MKRFIPLIFMAALAALPAAAQQSDGEDTEDTFELVYASNQKGDKFIKMALSPVIPLGFFNQQGDPSLYVGGLLGLGFHVFVTDKLAIGGDAGFGFNATVGNNIFDYIPVVATATWQLQYRRWEFPLTVGLGFAWELYNGYTYWPGLIVEAQAGGVFRINTNWAVGGELTYMFMPEFDADPAKSWMGHFLDATVTARYYF